jgi:hypothetical protein
MPALAFNWNSDDATTRRREVPSLSRRRVVGVSLVEVR